MNPISQWFEHIKTRYDKLVDVINTSYWFIPTVCIVLSFFALYVTQFLDRAQFFRDWPFISDLYEINPVGARTVLTTVATSVITITSIAFSMIVVTLTLASTQYGPRLLRNFMQDKKTQLALGIFVSTFTYCLALIRFVSSDDQTPFVPGLGLSFVLFLALASIFGLVFLIHNVAISIQAESVVERCWICLKQDISRIFSEHEKSVESDCKKPTWQKHFKEAEICSHQDGYLQLIDYPGLLKYLQKNNARMVVSVKPGQYLITSTCIAKVFTERESESALVEDFDFEEYFIVGKTRTPIQDPEFAINQLVEIGLRALSPSINDPFTAILCLNRLGSALVSIGQCGFPPTQLEDEKQQVRIERKTATFKGIVDCACNQLRQLCIEHPSVMIAMLEMLTEVSRSIDRADRKNYIVEQGTMLIDMAKDTTMHKRDLDDLMKRYEELKLR